MTSQYQKAEDIAKLIEARMQQITVAGGYETDIGTRVLRGARKVDDSWVPCSVIIEGNDKPEQSPSLKSAVVKIEQNYVLGGYTQCDPQNPNDAAHKIIRDLKKAMFADGANLAEKVVKIEYKGRDIGPRTDGVAIVFAIIELTVTYVEKLSEP